MVILTLQKLCENICLKVKFINLFMMYLATVD